MQSRILRGLSLTLAGMASILPGSVSATDYLAFEAFVESRMEAYEVPGVSIAVVAGGELRHSLALGVKDSRTGEPVDEATVFQVGSISKPVAAWTAMRMVQEGRIDLDTPVNEYLTQWSLPASEFDSDGVTVRRLLSHTAGLSLHGYPGFAPSQALPSVTDSLDGATNGMGAVYMQQAPGADFSYSGGGYTLLQLLLTEVSGQPFSELAQSAVLQPLGMTSSSYRPSGELLARASQGHDYYRRVQPSYRFAAEAAASLHTTARDLARFAIANMGENPLLDTRNVSAMHSAVHPDRDWNGMGFFLDVDGQVVGHGGSNIGWKALLRIVPSTGDALILLSNSDSGQHLFLEVECYWDSTMGPGLQTEQCSSDLEQRDRARRFMQIATAVCLLFALALLVLSGRKLIKGPVRLSLRPFRSVRTALAVAMVLLSISWWLLVHTHLGIELLYGFPFGRAIDTVGPDAPALSGSGLALLLSWAVYLLTRRPARTGDA